MPAVPPGSNPATMSAVGPKFRSMRPPTRLSWVGVFANATSASANENVRHAVLKVQQVLWAAAVDNDIPLSSASQMTTPRIVEIQLDGGLLLRGGLNIGGGQRLSDYLESQQQFIPIRNGVLLRSGRPPKEVNVTLGDVVLNQEAIQAVWELDAQTEDDAEPAEAVPEGSPT